MDTRPVLVLAGLRRSGKSSIQRVVFSRMSPNETLFLESTHRPARHAVPGFVDFELWDLPGHADDAAAAPDLDWRRCGGLVFVLDAQDDYIDALARLHATLLAVLPGNPALPVHIFIHKVDSLPPDSLSDLQRELHARLSDELGESGINVEPSWYLTSIYDHSVFEAMSKVVQRMLKEGGGLENLLNHFCSSSTIDKAFLFDPHTKLHLATDSTPLDDRSYELCSDALDCALDLSGIYSGAPLVAAEIQLGGGRIVVADAGKGLALVALLREGMERRAALQWNVERVKRAVEEIAAVSGR